MSRLRQLHPHHQVGLLLGFLLLLVVGGLAISSTSSPTAGPAAATSAQPAEAGQQTSSPDDASPRPHVGRPQVGTRPGPRGEQPDPAQETPLAPVPDGVSLVSAQMSYGGLDRTYLLATPKQATGRLPLLIDLHGRGVGPRFAAQQSGLLSWVAQGLAVAVYPAGYDMSWNAGGCCGVAASRHVNDLGFVRAVALKLAGRPDVDAAQLAVLGFSNGGRMALDLACSRYLSGGGLTLRAVVAIESINSARCIRGPGIPTLVTAGTDDPFVGYDAPTFDPEGGRLPSAQQEVASWSASEQCVTPVTSVGVFPQETFDCPSGALNLVTIPGGRHRWPPAIDPTIQTFLRTAVTLPST